MLHPMLIKCEVPPAENMPNHWDLLTKADIDEYLALRNSFYEQIKKSKKGERLDSFNERLYHIRRYIEKGDGEEWKRSLVCGVIFLSQSLAINIQQFRILLGKCKSSINGSLQQLGYLAQPQGGPIDRELFTKIPLFQKEHSEIKKWTIRENKNHIEICKAPPPHILPMIKTEIQTIPIIHQTQVIDPKPEIDLGTIKKIVKTNYPCPIKFRSKIYDALHQSVSIQTEA